MGGSAGLVRLGASTDTIRQFARRNTIAAGAQRRVFFHSDHRVAARRENHRFPAMNRRRRGDFGLTIRGPIHENRGSSRQSCTIVAELAAQFAKCAETPTALMKSGWRSRS